MKDTPLDLRLAQFRSKMRGFDPEEVTKFLGETADELEQAVKEVDRLRQEAARTEATLADLHRLLRDVVGVARLQSRAPAPRVHRGAKQERQAFPSRRVVGLDAIEKAGAAYE